MALRIGMVMRFEREFLAKGPYVQSTPRLLVYAKISYKARPKVLPGQCA